MKSASTTASATRPEGAPAQASEPQAATSGSRHTPGPWRKGFHEATGMTESDMEDRHTICADSDSGFNLVIAELVSGSPETQLANARLIAAAPETKAQRDALLVVCEEIAASGCDLGTSERRIRLYYAITQAGGKL